MNTGTVRVVTFTSDEDARAFDRAAYYGRVLIGDEHTNIRRLVGVSSVPDPREKISLRRWILENGSPMAYPATASIPPEVLRQVKRRGKWTKRLEAELKGARRG